MEKKMYCVSPTATLRNGFYNVSLRRAREDNWGDTLYPKTKVLNRATHAQVLNESGKSVIVKINRFRTD